MNSKSIFNATVCLLGVAILLVHIVNAIVKKDKRKDENCILIFFIFTAIHFLTYFTFTMIKLHYTSNVLITTFYTIFYIMNNMEVFILFYYFITYIDIPKSSRRSGRWPAFPCAHRVCTAKGNSIAGRVRLSRR